MQPPLVLSFLTPRSFELVVVREQWTDFVMLYSTEKPKHSLVFRRSQLEKLTDFMSDFTLL